MRILHTGDWHLGRTLEGRSRQKEQEQFVDELVRIADSSGADLILMAGMSMIRSILRLRRSSYSMTRRPD